MCFFFFSKLECLSNTLLIYCSADTVNKLCFLTCFLISSIWNSLKKLFIKLMFLSTFIVPFWYTDIQLREPICEKVFHNPANQIYFFQGPFLKDDDPAIIPNYRAIFPQSMLHGITFALQCLHDSHNVLNKDICLKFNFNTEYWKYKFHMQLEY